jgi:hypothetical protein
MIHQCTECGLTHDHAAPPPPDPAVEIARIEAESRLAVARLSARAEEHMAESMAEARVGEAEAYAEAEVAATQLQADAITEVYEDSSPEAPEMDAPVIIQQENEGDEFTPPEAEPHEPPAESRKKGLGLW